MGADAPAVAARQRLDKWLWQARFFKTRTLAGKAVGAAHVRVNAVKVSKAATPVGPGDVLTFFKSERVRVIEIVGIGARRGPAAEAQQLYVDRSPPPAPRDPVQERVGGRPTGKDRRMMEALKGRHLE